ncbi:MAG: hypothetical protein GKR98_15205 [Boseongicola sp.]|nr:MAG: hypothetical protein GKR98_15205 [Boseongicola sp.]
MKVLLPLAALAILSTLFLVAESLDPNRAIPFAEVDVEAILRDQGITAPSFGGMTEDGAEITLGAAAIRPVTENGTTQFRGTELAALINLPNGTSIAIDSPVGLIDPKAQLVTLEGGAELASSLGYFVRTERLVTSFGDVQATANTRVTATGPGGDLVAGAMTLEQRPADGSYLLVFNEGVRLVYHPQP